MKEIYSINFILFIFQGANINLIDRLPNKLKKVQTDHVRQLILRKFSFRHSALDRCQTDRVTIYINANLSHTQLYFITKIIAKIQSNRKTT